MLILPSKLFKSIKPKKQFVETFSIAKLTEYDFQMLINLNTENKWEQGDFVDSENVAYNGLKVALPGFGEMHLISNGKVSLVLFHSKRHKSKFRSFIYQLDMINQYHKNLKEKEKISIKVK